MKFSHFQQKVRLIKEMKAESEKYRVWKAQTDRTINKLKSQVYFRFPFKPNIL